jgi:hypothetical protein
VFQNYQELQNAIAKIDNHFARFGLTMHLGNGSTKSKTECMYFSPTLKDVKKQICKKMLPEEILLPDGKRVHLITFKYLGSTITPLLNEDTEIEERIKKAKSMMGASRHFFDNKDVDWQVKKEVYTRGPLNALLWGSKLWNLTRRNIDKLKSFHHRAIRRILNIKWQEVREDHIKNKEIIQENS